MNEPTALDLLKRLHAETILPSSPLWREVQEFLDRQEKLTPDQKLDRLNALIDELANQIGSPSTSGMGC